MSASTARLLPCTPSSMSTILLLACSSRCRRSSSSRTYSLPSTGLVALSWMMVDSVENETLGSAGLRASITRSEMVTPLGSSHEASLTEFGCSQVSSTPSSTSGELSVKES